MSLPEDFNLSQSSENVFAVCLILSWYISVTRGLSPKWYNSLSWHSQISGIHPCCYFYGLTSTKQRFSIRMDGYRMVDGSDWGCGSRSGCIWRIPLTSTICINTYGEREYGLFLSRDRTHFISRSRILISHEFVKSATLALIGLPSTSQPSNHPEAKNVETNNSLYHSSLSCYTILFHLNVNWLGKYMI